MKPVEAVLVGAGSRGFDTYGAYAHRFPQQLNFIAVAEPNEQRRLRLAAEHNIPHERCFASWEDLLAKPQFAPALINSTSDQLHMAVTKAAVEKGYHVLVEKPLAANPQDCMAIVKAADKCNRIVQVGHCLRYTPYYGSLYTLLHSGRIGELMDVEYKENVSFPHFCHSFIRGKFSNSEKSSPMIVAKTCHDLDILVWCIGKKCKRVSCFGSQSHFRKEKAPADAPRRCTDGCPYEHDCKFSAIKQYIVNPGSIDNGYGPAEMDVCPSKDRNDRFRALATGPYGRCVYHCDNNQPDHLVANLEFEGDITVAFTLQAFTHLGTRMFCFYGTDGQIVSPIYGTLIVDEFAYGKHEQMQTGHPEGGHGGGDFGLLHNFVAAVRKDDPRAARSSARESLESHLIGFAIEKSRLEGRVIEMKDFISEIEA